MVRSTGSSAAGSSAAGVRSARGEEITPPSVSKAGKAGKAEKGMDRRARDAYLAVHVADSRFTQEIERLCRGHGITQAQYTVLWVLCVSQDPEGLPIGSIADGLLTRSGDTSRLVDRLVVGGHATRVTSAADRRVSHVRPTDEGRLLFATLVAEMNALHRTQWGALDGDEVVQLTLLINKALWPAPDERS